MTDTADTQRDYRDTVFLPKTDFPMKAGLAAKEPAILARWAEQDLYGRLRKERAGRERFILHDGPPYANGDIHMGHAMNKVLKDIIVRSQSLMGKDAPYVPGWDCHGLPIEWKIEEAYRKKKLNKDEVPAAEFRAECRAYAAHWVQVQREQFERLGVMGDWDDPYLTMKFDAEAAIVGELLKFAESGQLYRGAKPVMWSPVEKTALAEAEVEYEDITSTQIDVAFQISSWPSQPQFGGTAHAVIWTTTPWTIPVNQALAYGEDVDYVGVQFDLGSDYELGFDVGHPDMAGGNGLYEALRGQVFIVAEARMTAFVGRVMRALNDQMIDPKARFSSDVSLVWRGKGSDLAGAVARHPMHHLGGFFAKPRPFLPGDFVTTDQGTGLVHMAPDHGEDDFLLCKAHGLDPVFAVDGAGMYRADWAWLGGQGSVINKKFNAPDGPICSDLRAAGALLAASEDFSHSYPHSWRSKAKVIFRATPQWFIPMDAPSGAHVSTSLDTNGERDAFQPPFVSSEVEKPSPVLGHAQGNQPTLRELALDAIERTRWVPAKSRNRIAAMVEGRPDWVISRQRAWGVPIALYVHRVTGEYLRDREVNTRIIDAVNAGGADAWYQIDHQTLLGDKYDLADYEVVTDILDVWFDSGSTHAFVIEQRYGEGVRANLYLEGSDQHRGWFQSSLLESAGTRGRAPYDAVLTHGFALDGQGKKMSKSSGNVVDPLKIIGESGADILRLWVASTDYFEDVRIGKEVLATTGDAYRKLRNTFRYLLGALDGFDASERLGVNEMPELERYVLHLLAALDAELKSATEAFEFNRYARALTDFCNEDLSAFFFDIRKDVLYCDAPGSATRRAYRTVLETLFHALVRYAAPILCFTAEEVWQTRFPDADSVHLLEWPELTPLFRHPREGGGPASSSAESVEGQLDSRLRGNDELRTKWRRVRELRNAVTEQIEPLRRAKEIRSSLEANVTLGLDHDEALMLRSVDFTEICIAGDVSILDPYQDASGELPRIVERTGGAIGVLVAKTNNHKCGRCWRHRPEVVADGALCSRCAEVVA